MNFTVYPGYEPHLLNYFHNGSEEVLKYRKMMRDLAMHYEVPAGMRIEDREIDGPEEGQKIAIRLYIPGDAGESAPVIMDVHGGGFVIGDLDMDNARCIAVAKRVPAIVVSVDYRLSVDGVHFPQPMEDLRTAYLWIRAHAREFGGDPEQVATMGSSAGGTMVAGLSLLLRDKNDPAPNLTLLFCPPLRPGMEETMSHQQMFDIRVQFGPEGKANSPEAAYLGGYDGTTPSYYAFPAYCHDVAGLGPHMIIAGEYDALRDTALEYGDRLLKAGVPTELLIAPRMGHCFNTMPHPYTDLVHDAMAMSLQREFHMLDSWREQEPLQENQF